MINYPHDGLPVAEACATIWISESTLRRHGFAFSYDFTVCRGFVSRTVTKIPGLVRNTLSTFGSSVRGRRTFSAKTVILSAATQDCLSKRLTEQASEHSGPPGIGRCRGS